MTKAIQAMHKSEFPAQAKTTKIQKLIKMCGFRMTALHLKRKEYSLDEALQLLLGTRERVLHVRTAEQVNEFNYL